MKPSQFPRHQPSWRKLVAKASANAPSAPARVLRQKHDRGGAVPEPALAPVVLPQRYPVTGSTGQTIVFDSEEAATAFIDAALDAAIAAYFAESKIVL